MWKRLCGASGLVLVVAAPALVVAETWRGRPLIDQPGYWWLVPAAVVLGGFLLGGVVAGRCEAARDVAINGRRSAHPDRWGVRGAGLGAAVGSIGVLLLVVADVLRRTVVVGEPVTLPVVGLWLLGAAAAVAVAAAGGAISGWRKRSDRLSQSRLQGALGRRDDAPPRRR